MDVISLFSGAGGLDLGFEQAGYNIIWANDSDKFAVQTYNENFQNEAVLADINKINYSLIPKADILIGGFPCQSFSTIGEMKGFDDARGTLFFSIAEILDNLIKRDAKPKAIVLENVRGLKTHDKGKTFKVIINILENVLDYKIYTKVLNSADYGIPQNRRRTFIVGFADHDVEFEFPKKMELNLTMQDLLEKDVNEKYFLSDRILPTILSTGTGGWQAKPETDLEIARPLTATMHKMHRASQDNYVTQKGKLRRLTPREAARLQGFPEDFEWSVSDTQAYRQFGNAVTVPVANKVALQVKKSLSRVTTNV